LHFSPFHTTSCGVGCGPASAGWPNALGRQCRGTEHEVSSRTGPVARSRIEADRLGDFEGDPGRDIGADCSWALIVMGSHHPELKTTSPAPTLPRSGATPTARSWWCATDRRAAVLSPALPGGLRAGARLQPSASPKPHPNRNTKTAKPLIWNDSSGSYGCRSGPRLPVRYRPRPSRPHVPSTER
jgi:hypothetical protein